MNINKQLLAEVIGWCDTHQINGVEFSAHALKERIQEMQAQFAGYDHVVNEAHVHKAIKPFLTPTLQGKVMGALRATIDMYNPSNPTKEVDTLLLAVTPAVIDHLDEEPSDQVVEKHLNSYRWNQVANALRRDSAFGIALYQAGLSLLRMERGYKIVPMVVGRAA